MKHSEAFLIFIKTGNWGKKTEPNIKSVYTI